MKQVVVMLMLIATAFAGSICPTKVDHKCTCNHYHVAGDEIRGRTEFSCVLIDKDTFADVIQTLQNKTIDEFVLRNLTFTTLDKDAFAGANIIRLVISQSPIKEVHEDAFRGVPALAELVITTTFISKVPNFKHVSHSLQFISLTENPLQSLKAEEFANLERIHTIELDRNKIAQTEEGLFQDMIRLDSLTISGNLIKELDDWWFPKTVKLRYMDLSHNRLSSISSTFFANATSTIQELDLTDNRLTTISEGFKIFLGLYKRLLLDENPIICDARLCWIGQILEGKEWANLRLKGKCSSPRHFVGTSLSDLTEDALDCPTPPAEAPMEHSVGSLF